MTRPRIYSDERMIQILRDRIAENGGKAPAQHSMSPYFSLYVTRFGSWGNALHLAGYDATVDRKPNVATPAIDADRARAITERNRKFWGAA